MSERGVYLVRVSKEMVAELLDKESAPVVVVSINRFDDDTYEMMFRQVDSEVTTR